jgi:hypothetical protein
MGTSQTVAEKVMNAVNLPIITSVTQTQNLVVTDARLRLPIGALNATPVAHALSATDTIQRLNSPLSDSITPVPVKTEVITAPKLELSGQLFKVAQSIRGQISASDLHQIRFVRVDSSEASSRPISQAQTSLANPSNTGTNTNTTMVTAQSNLNAGSQTAGTATIQSPPVTSANQTAAQRTTNAFPQHQQNKQSAQAHVAIKPSPKATTETLRVLGAPSIETRAESRIPAELTIGLWLKEVDKQIAQSPPHLQAQLKQKAEQLLQHNFAPELKVQPSQQSGSEKSSDKDELPLIAVRNWLDATQARIQNSAINNAMHQWSFPDTTVQHMQLPLIWLGLTSWADLEWWQEKPKRKNSREKSAEEKNRWRMRMFLTLDPLAPMCADIDWSTDMTQVTFWSEDTSTLAHLNQLLPTLSSWTQGLGENSLTTKHGMPKKVSKSTETATTENHLVDIRT